MAKNLILLPARGTFEVEDIKEYLHGRKDVFLDPLGTGIYLMCGVPEAVEYRRQERLQDSARFPYMCLVQVEPERVHIIQEMADAEELRSARAFLRWMCERFVCRIRDDYGQDLTERCGAGDIDKLYPPGL